MNVATRSLDPWLEVKSGIVGIEQGHSSPLEGVADPALRRSSAWFMTPCRIGEIPEGVIEVDGKTDTAVGVEYERICPSHHNPMTM